ncbi:hypothetical protein ACLK11_21965 [Escherichia coli]
MRKSQPLRFTPQGEILLQLANQVLPQISQALQACNEPQQTRLRIAIECHSCIQWLTPALENFHKNWPQVEMDFKSGVTFDPQPAFATGRAGSGDDLRYPAAQWPALFADVRL